MRLTDQFVALSQDASEIGGYPKLCVLGSVHVNERCTYTVRKSHLPKLAQTPFIKVRKTKESLMAECGCGRSPTGKCVGWHDLTEEQYLEKKAAYEAKKAAK